MIALIQRVAEAAVRVEGRTVGEIGAGLLALVCAERGDTEREAERLLDKLLAYRVFADDAGRMNRSLQDTGGQLLVVSQFTLAADTNSGTRPSFTPAAPPETGRRLYEHFVACARRRLVADASAALTASAAPDGLDAPDAPDATAAADAPVPPRVATGEFGAHMRVALVNDGPVTFWLRIPPAAAA